MDLTTPTEALRRRIEQLRAQAAEAREMAFQIEDAAMRIRLIQAASAWMRKADQLEGLLQRA